MSVLQQPAGGIQSFGGYAIPFVTGSPKFGNARVQAYENTLGSRYRIPLYGASEPPFSGQTGTWTMLVLAPRPSTFPYRAIVDSWNTFLANAGPYGTLAAYKYEAGSSAIVSCTAALVSCPLDVGPENSRFFPIPLTFELLSDWV